MHTSNPGLPRDRQAAGARCSLLPPFPFMSLLLSPLLPLGGSGSSQGHFKPRIIPGIFLDPELTEGVRFQLGGMEPYD